MDLSRLPLFDMIARRMAWLSQRQEVLAQNIANADTPGYRPNDLVAMDFRRALSADAGLGPAATHAAHFGLSPDGGERPFKVAVQRETWETAPSGNAVVIEEQVLKVAETQLDYQMVTNLYRKHLELLKLALGRATG